MQRHSLTEGSISRGLLLFTLPILYGNVLQSLNASVNSFWVGRYLGEAALTATSNANSLLFLLLGGVFGLSMAATILVGVYLGAKRTDDAKRVVGTSATFFALLSVIMAVAGAVFAERILVAMRTPADSLPLAIAYTRVIFFGLPFSYMYAFIMSVLRGAGDSRTPFRFLLVSVALDIVLNPLLIFGIGPFPRLGIAGSAWATAFAQLVTLVALIVHLYRIKHPLRLARHELHLFKPDLSVVRTLIVKGVPMGLQLLVISLSGVLMITLVNRFGTDTTAAYGAALQVWQYILMPAFAIGMAVSSMAAQNVGAQKWDRVHSIARHGVLFSGLLTGAIVVLLEIFSRQALGLFLPDGSVALHAAEHLNRISAVSFVLLGISMVLFGVVRATGAVFPPLVILTISLLGVRFPLAFSLLDTWQADAIWWSFPISSLLAVVLAGLYYKYGGWRNARLTTSAQRPAPQEPAEVVEPSGP
ncbi:MAG TPA: MATE family efflux transporter [Steroidobacteraceae bacterium]|nr:MATE family efflux transporter [Steroidobacteraceae bacterium]